ncbi:MAG: FHA domain-containing protein, partial [Anaerolineales bacterium]
MVNSPSYILQISVKHYTSDEHPILKPEVTLGRRPDNDVILEERNISGHHAKLLLASERLLIVDLGSRNGTYLNGRPLPPKSPMPFRPGDEIRLGAFHIKVRRAGKGTSVPPVIAPRIKMSAQAQPGLVVWEDHRCLKHPIERLPLRIGRSPDNEVRIRNSRISSCHARIERVGDGVRIVDLDSRNGLFYRGQRVDSRRLRDGDVVQLGQSVALQFRAHIGFVSAQPAAEKRRQTPSTQALDLRGRDIVKIGRSRDNDIVLVHP